MTIEMQPLTGTSAKQIQYGEDMRRQWVESIERSLTRATPEQAEIARKAVAVAVATQPAAKWWIESNPKQAMNAAYLAALKDMGAL